MILLERRKCGWGFARGLRRRPLWDASEMLGVTGLKLGDKSGLEKPPRDQHLELEAGLDEVSMQNWIPTQGSRLGVGSIFMLFQRWN